MDLKKLSNVAEIAAKIMSEQLKGQQHKLDVDKDGKIEGEDLAKLRAAKQVKKEEVEQVNEADIEKTATGIKVYGSSYGNSQRARREQVKKSVDSAKGPKMKDLEAIEGEKKKKKFSEMVNSYKDGGLKSIVEMIAEEPSQEEFNAEIETAKKKAKGELRNDKNIAAGKVEAVKVVEQIEEGYTLGEKTPNKQGGHNQDVHYNGKKIGHIESYSHRTGTKYGMEHQASGEGTAGSRSHEEALADLKNAHKEHMSSVKEEVEQVEERSLSEPEMKKREEIVKSMKKGMAGFKARYGERAKEVMYATATKQAKKD